MAQKAYPKNDSIRNGGLVALYLFCLRKKWRRLARILGLVLACEIRCDVPERLFIPHPSGIVTGTRVQISNDVVLLQQVTLGCRSAYQGGVPDDGDPTIEEGVYVGPGAKILGRVTIGAWSIIGANAVVTASVPPHSIVVGHNKILPQTTK
ncbi:MAG: serine acetyltransferase [Verrucomicrobiae bacterium]|nr:serine acetyltransferase [Verrucomicrobiae bacterium]